MAVNRHRPAIGSAHLFWVAARAWLATSIITFFGMTLSYIFNIEYFGIGLYVITIVVAVAYNLRCLLRVQPLSIGYSIGLHVVFWPVACVLFMYSALVAACLQGDCL